MSTNEKDPKENGFQLTPESMAPGAVPSWQKSRAVEDTPQPPSEKNGNGAKIAIGVSAACVLLAGLVIVVVLAANGTLFKGKKKLSQESEAAAATAETTAKQAGTSSASTPTPTPGKTGSTEFITSLSQITDRQYAKMHDMATHTLLSCDADGIGLPDTVTIDKMIFLGSYRCEEWEGMGKHITNNVIVENIYQVQVTDKSGAQPVKHQFFCAYGFSEVRQDGSIDGNTVYLPPIFTCFGDWSVHGCLDLDRLLNSILTREGPTVMGGNVDKSKMIPFEGTDPADFEEHPHAKALADIPQYVLDRYKREAEGWMAFCLQDMGSVKGQKIQDSEYVGIALASSPTEEKNLVYIVFKWTYIDMDEEPPVEKETYWYVSFEDCIVGWEMFSGSTRQNMDPMNPREWIKYGMTNLADLRQHLSGLKYGWNYEDNFIEETKGS